MLMVLFIGKEVPNNPPKLTVNLATLHARSHGCGCLCSSHSTKGIVTEYSRSPTPTVNRYDLTPPTRTQIPRASSFTLTYRLATGGRKQITLATITEILSGEHPIVCFLEVDKTCLDNYT